ncbi:hypothetical protein HZH68_008877 [Vespula germanica]|uniref:Uncharacterized protein n=1 Tax=Vespula germanica TaxID=30212 RepID=A0A834N6L3_VESGE|nr:hypothetical protein HZH68_008877 [Vespula germanica]
MEEVEEGEEMKEEKEEEEEEEEVVVVVVIMEVEMEKEEEEVESLARTDTLLESGRTLDEGEDDETSIGSSATPTTKNKTACLGCPLREDKKINGPPAGCGIESASRQRKGNLREKRGVRGKRQKEVEKKEEEEDEEEEEEEEVVVVVLLLVTVAMAMVVVVLLLLKEVGKEGRETNSGDSDGGGDGSGSDNDSCVGDVGIVDGSDGSERSEHPRSIRQTRASTLPNLSRSRVFLQKARSVDVRAQCAESVGPL